MCGGALVWAILTCIGLYQIYEYWTVPYFIACIGLYQINEHWTVPYFIACIGLYQTYDHWTIFSRLEDCIKCMQVLDCTIFSCVYWTVPLY